MSKNIQQMDDFPQGFVKIMFVCVRQFTWLTFPLKREYWEL